jgi:hypothetical protein
MASPTKIVVRDDPAPDVSSVWRWLLSPALPAPVKDAEDKSDGVESSKPKGEK